MPATCNLTTLQHTLGNMLPVSNNNMFPKSCLVLKPVGNVSSSMECLGRAGDCLSNSRTDKMMLSTHHSPCRPWHSVWTAEHEHVMGHPRVSTRLIANNVAVSDSRQGHTSTHVVIVLCVCVCVRACVCACVRVCV